MKNPITALDHFENAYAERINSANEDFQMLSSGKITSLFERSSLVPPVIKYKEVRRLYSHVESDAKDRKSFYRLFQSSGGCILLEFEDCDDDRDKIETMEAMWSTIKVFFALKNRLSKEQLAQQFLPDEDKSGHEEQHKGGYDFIQTHLDGEGTVTPTIIQNMLCHTGESEIGVTRSFALLARISEMIATIAISGALDEDPRIIRKFMEEILDGFSCSNHRLCQYLPVKCHEVDYRVSESLLRCHTDWSLVTCIPVSPTPGLLVHHPSKKWTAPDAINGRGNRSHHCYCLVMAGKSLDLVIGEENGLACIHKVVSAGEEQRVTAPFFLRTKESISRQIDELYNQSSCSKIHAISTINRLFQKILKSTKLQ